MCQLLIPITSLSLDISSQNNGEKSSHCNQLVFNFRFDFDYQVVTQLRLKMLKKNSNKRINVNKNCVSPTMCKKDLHLYDKGKKQKHDLTWITSEPLFLLVWLIFYLNFCSFVRFRGIVCFLFLRASALFDQFLPIHKWMCRGSQPGGPGPSIGGINKLPGGAK